MTLSKLNHKTYIDDTIDKLEHKSMKINCDCYFEAGQHLALLYIMIPQEKNIKNNFSSRNIAQEIIDSSVYYIDFLSKCKKSSEVANIDSIKAGFRYTYDTIINNKFDFIGLLNNLLSNDSAYLTSIIPKIYGLNDVDLKRQLYFLDVRFLKNQNQQTHMVFSDDVHPNRINRHYALTLASNLGDHIIQRGIIGFNDLATSRTWINTIKKGNKIILSPANYNLYDGNSGIALFLLYLGVVTKKDYYIYASIEAMRESISHINMVSAENEIKIEDYYGIAGQIYTLSKIYSITKNEAIKETIKKGISKLYTLLYTLINECIDFTKSECMMDVLEVLLSLYENKELSDLKNTVLDLANLIYINIEHILSDSKAETGLHLININVAAALVRLFNITSNKKIENSIREILESERLICDKKISQPKAYDEKLLRLITLKKFNYNDEFIDNEINEALDFTIKNSFGKTPYYNGDIRTLEILEYAADVLGDNGLKNRCINTYNKLLGEVIAPYINEEINLANKPTTLMTGIVGHGYSLLRKCCDSTVPSVLLLE